MNSVVCSHCPNHIGAEQLIESAHRNLDYFTPARNKRRLLTKMLLPVKVQKADFCQKILVAIATKAQSFQELGRRRRRRIGTNMNEQRITFKKPTPTGHNPTLSERHQALRAEGWRDLTTEPLQHEVPRAEGGSTNESSRQMSTSTHPRLQPLGADTDATPTRVGAGHSQWRQVPPSRAIEHFSRGELLGTVTTADHIDKVVQDSDIHTTPRRLHGGKKTPAVGVQVVCLCCSQAFSAVVATADKQLALKFSHAHATPRTHHRRECCVADATIAHLR